MRKGRKNNTFETTSPQQPEKTDRRSEPLVDMIPGSRLSGRYMVKEKIGEGGMGRVYLAEDERLEKEVAVKMLSASFAGKSIAAERFIREAKVVTRIKHKNVIDVTDLDVTDQGIPFYVMEYLKGQDLMDLILAERNLPWERGRDIAVQICRALGEAHSKGIVHRDMKSENVFMVEHEEEGDHVKLLDFGIAKLLKDIGEGQGDITIAGDVIGTPRYMAPEQAMGKVDTDPRADIYSVGIIIYEMLTGTVPFDHESVMGILSMQINEKPERPSRRKAGIPDDVEAVVMRALEKEPESRYQTIGELEDALERCKGALGTSPLDEGGGMAIEAYARIKRNEAARAAKVRNRRAAALFLAVASAASIYYAPQIQEAYQTVVSVLTHDND